MNAIVGIPLSDYSETLVKVDPDVNPEQPWDSFDGMEAIGARGRREIISRGYDIADTRFADVITGMSLRDLSALSFDQMCKIKHSSIYMLSDDVRDLFETKSFEHMLVHKIGSSMWRWGYKRGAWNDIVEFHQNIRTFDLDIDGFEIRLDHSTYFNECGYSQYSRTFLDGVFAFLVYYKGEHVMTIGFSLMADRRILIQQIQLTRRRGNRFLFKMPANRVEHIIGRFHAAFPTHELFIADGGDVINKSLKSYQRAYDAVCERRAKMAIQVAKADEATIARHLLLGCTLIDHETKLEDEARIFMEKIEHATAEVDRLRAFYANGGRYKQRKRGKIETNGITHYRIAV